MSNAEFSEHEYMTVLEVAAVLSVSRDSILHWIRDKKLPAVNISRSKRPMYRIHRDNVVIRRCPKPDKEYV